jgi:hypothetical protein
MSERSGRRRWFAGGCLGVFVVLGAIGVYLYSREQASTIEAPRGELASVRIRSGEAFTLPVTWEGRGRAFLRAYIDLGPRASSGDRMQGRFVCEGHDGAEAIELEIDDLYRYEADDWPRGLHELDTWEITRAATFECSGTITMTPARSARVFIDDFQRPSQWLGLDLQ